MSPSSLPTHSRAWVLANKPSDMPVLDGPDTTFKLETHPLPELKEEQVLLKTLYLSNDPAQRGWISPFVKPERLYTAPVKVGTPMHARGLAEVVASESEKVKQGSIVTASVCWNEYAVRDAKDCNPVSELPGGLSMTHYLGALGLTGMTAWYGLTVIAEAKKEDVVVVSGAAGATGSMVVQIAKHIVGCKKVIGIAGSAAKCRWVESLGADVCLNYKDGDWQEKMIEATPDFANVYFDNVGGEVLDFMVTRMARYGRISACGAIADYNKSEGTGMKNWFDVITMRLSIKGFIVIDYLGKAAEMIGIFKKAMQEGKLKIGEESEQVVETRFEDVPRTWMKLFDGGNTGKLITKIV